MALTFIQWLTDSLIMVVFSMFRLLSKSWTSLRNIQKDCVWVVVHRFITEQTFLGTLVAESLSNTHTWKITYDCVSAC